MLQDYLEQLCDAFQDALCVSDTGGVVVLVNTRHSELTGIPKTEMLGRKTQDLVDMGLFDVALNPEVVRTGRPATSVQTIFNGRTMVLDGHPVFDAEGRVIFVVTFIRDVTALSELREQLTAQRELLDTFRQLSHAAPEQQPSYPRVVHSHAMRALYADMAAVAATDATVLLLGETGVGKDVLARRIHAQSPRADKVFIKVDCGSIPENLIETELFGYEAGTFSGASKHGKAGLIEAASSGTLFLDEIGELPLTMQSRLLRVLQDWEVVRVGATTPQKVDVRVIAATNKDLETEVSRGRFRSDLYYRLKVAVLTIPPLRARRADIQPLARGFLDYYGTKYHKRIAFAPDAEQALQAHSWPGNVRELENLVQGLVVTAKKPVIDAAALPLPRPAPRAVRSQGAAGNSVGAELPDALPLPALDGKSYKEIVKELEHAFLRAALAKYGTIGEVARALRVDRSTVFRKVRDMENGGGGS